MTKAEILHLGRLARIKLSEAEIQQFQTEIDAVLAYVGRVNDIIADTALAKNVGPVHNVFREDEIANDPGSCTPELLAAMPDRQGDYLRVPKILSQN